MTAPAKFGFAALPRAARAAFQWRLLLLWVLWMLVPTAILVQPLWQLLSANLDNSVHAATIAQQMDMTVFTDLMAAHGKRSAAFSNAALLALLATLLISPLLSGMAASAARAPSPLNLKGLMAGGLAEYPRMLRMLLWAVVPLGIAAALGGMALEAAAANADAAMTAFDTRLARYGASALLAFLLALAHASLDAGRAALAIDRRRDSALKAWWDGCKLLARRPFATLGVYFAISAAGLGLAAALAVARLNVPGATLAGFAAALLLTQMMVVTIAWMRSARLFAMIELARSQR